MPPAGLNYYGTDSPNSGCHGWFVAREIRWRRFFSSQKTCSHCQHRFSNQISQGKRIIMDDSEIRGWRDEARCESPGFHDEEGGASVE
jgi:hypothetical protein